MKNTIPVSPGSENFEKQSQVRKQYKKPVLSKFGNLVDLTKGNPNPGKKDTFIGSTPSTGPVRRTPTSVH